MKDIKQLVTIITPDKIKTLDCPPFRKGSKLEQFYLAVYTEVVKTDEEAQLRIYGDSKKYRNRYYKLKNDLKEKLLMTLLFVADDKKNENRRELFLRLSVSMLQFLFLKDMGGMNYAVKMGVKLLKIVEKYEFTKIALDLSRYLANHYALITGDEKEAKKYFDKLEFYDKMQHAENDSFIKSRDLAMRYVKDKSIKNHIFDLANQYLKEMEAYMPKKKSLFLINNYYLVMVTKYMSVQDYLETIGACEKAVKEISAKKTNSSLQTSFLSQMIISHIQLKQFDKAREVIERRAGFIEAGSFNWFKGQELLFKLHCTTGDYTDAWITYKKSIANSKYHNLPELLKEVWNINHAYIRFLIAVGKVKLSFKEKLQLEEKPFSVGKFMNEMHNFSKDKKGLNITILTVYILWLLQKKQYDRLQKGVNTFMTHRYRYIDKEKNRRSYLFATMLFEVPKAHFNRKVLEKRTTDLFLELKSIPSDLNNEEHDVEVLPYEDVWDILLGMLKR